MSGISSRDRRALLLLLVLAVPTLLWYFAAGDPDSVTTEGAAAVLPLPVMEKRLVSLRQQTAMNPAKEEVRQALQSALEERERLLLTADTAQQVQAQLLTKVRGTLEAQDPPLRATQTDLSQISRLGDEYGEVAVTVGFNCTVEQLVNVLADVAASEQLIATRQLNVVAADRVKKTLNVRLTITGLMPINLAPEPTGGLRP